MSENHQSQTLTEHLLRYSAVASIVASGALITGAPRILADGASRELNCVMDADWEFCNIDFDNDGNREFRIVLIPEQTYMAGPDSAFYMFNYSNAGDAGLGFVHSGTSPFNAAVLPFGSTLSAARPDWISANAFITSSSGRGNWTPPQGHATNPTLGAYLGVCFTLNGGGVHYGWIELYIPTNDNVTVRRIGYDDTVGASIPAAVQMSGLESASDLRAVGAAASAALAGVFTWLRRKLQRA